jgi:hypothetical protein
LLVFFGPFGLLCWPCVSEGGQQQQQQQQTVVVTAGGSEVRSFTGGDKNKYQ